MIDARLSIIEERLSGIKRIIAVSSGKGGVGKSMVAAGMAVSLAKDGKAGLLDLDFYGPSAHIILGSSSFPEEKNGLIPPSINGVKFMSIIYFTGDKPAPLKGNDIINAIVELLTITIWNDLDYLVIDMPPGMGEEVMVILRFIKRAEFVVVTTPSILSWKTVKKLLYFLEENSCKISGVIENMILNNSMKSDIEKYTHYLGGIKFDENVEKYIGKANELMESNFGRDIKKIVDGIKTRAE